MRFIIYLFFLSFVFTAPLFSQENVEGVKKKRKPTTEEKKSEAYDYYSSNFLRYDNFIYDPEVKTVLLHRVTDELSPAIIKLNSEDEFLLSFDILNQKLRNLVYTFVHCNPAWEPSGLAEAEFLDGYFTNFITDFKFSFNTIKPYVHYKAIFPNENIQFKISGNYLLLVHEDGQADSPLITRRFVVYEERVMIPAKVNRASDPEERLTAQKIDFSITHGGYEIINPYRDLKVLILQNSRWDNAISNLKPLFIKGNELVYEYDKENVFVGGNEFRNLDIKTLRFQTERVSKIDYMNGKNLITLHKDLKRTFSRYSTQPDINGKYVIRIQEGFEHSVEADYAYVTFTLDYPTPLQDGNFYIFGGLSDWSVSDDFKMEYDEELKAFKKSVLLKQGFYNYQYIYLQDNKHSPDISFIEGSHFETENDYTILVYHKEPSLHYYKVVGFKLINSRGTF
jgi:hypothetical protein